MAVRGRKFASRSHHIQAEIQHSANKDLIDLNVRIQVIFRSRILRALLSFPTTGLSCSVPQRPLPSPDISSPHISLLSTESTLSIVIQHLCIPILFISVCYWTEIDTICTTSNARALGCPNLRCSWSRTLCNPSTLESADGFDRLFWWTSIWGMIWITRYSDQHHWILLHWYPDPSQ